MNEKKLTLIISILIISVYFSSASLFVDDDFSSNDIEGHWTVIEPGESSVEVTDEILEIRGGRGGGGSLSDRAYLHTSDELSSQWGTDAEMEANIRRGGSDARPWLIIWSDFNPSGTYGTPDNALMVQMAGSPSLRYYAQGGGSTTIDSSDKDLDIGEWYFVEFNVEGDHNSFDYEVYVDGELEMSGTDSTDFDETPYSGFGGREYDVAHNFDNVLIKEENPNEPPDEPSNPDPSNSEDTVEVEPDLSVDVSDPDGDSIDVGFYTSGGSLIGTDSDVCSGCTASVTANELDNVGTSYSWYAVADDGEETTLSDTWSFDTVHEPEAPVNPSPSDSVADVSTGSDLEVDVSHLDGLDMDVTFRIDPGQEGGYQTVAMDENVADGARASVNPDLSLSEDYDWYVDVDTRGYSTSATSSAWSFSTEHEVDVISENPWNGEDFVSADTNLEVELSHSDKSRSVDIAFEYREVGESQWSNAGTSTGVQDGEAASANPDLEQGVEYEWRVEVDGEDESESFTSEEWSFITENVEGEPNIEIVFGENENVNPFDGEDSNQGYLEVRPDHDTVSVLESVTLYDESNNEVVETYSEGAGAGEVLTMIWGGIEANKEYEWSAEVEHEGETAQTETVSFTTIAVEVALSGNVPNAEGYNIYRREDSETSDPSFDYGNMDYESVGIVDELDNVIRDVSEGLETRKTYCYVATAYNIGGEGPASDEECMQSEVQLE